MRFPSPKWIMFLRKQSRLSLFFFFTFLCFDSPNSKDIAWFDIRHDENSGMGLVRGPRFRCKHPRISPDISMMPARRKKKNKEERKKSQEQDNLRLVISGSLGRQTELAHSAGDNSSYNQSRRHIRARRKKTRDFQKHQGCQSF